ncbi:HAMP domain-containing sensor histidine kinase [Flavobacteriaceae bacterium S356]|uniref:histidine kinase n=1 Tax=Asprobacillus argus TaxID=3076534 RepID=A0ABU3LFP5_9FLAO|nr:HAMP domain-containing sensor histidine kinase [Flavobacteriaceae bacterium S356]
MMKRKINILIIASVAALITLSSIQYYLISNTFQLKKDTFIKEVKSQLKFIEVNERLESLDDSYNDLITDVLENYQNGTLPKEKLFSKVKQFNDSLNAKFETYFENTLKEKSFPYTVNFQEQIVSAVILKSTGNDTILSPKSDGILLFGSSLNPKTRISFNSNQWTSNSLSEDDERVLEATRSLHFEIRSHSYIDIPEWRYEVLKQMTGLLSLSVISILTVILLFIYALSSFIKQKKVADIKTDFINNITHELKTPLATLSVATKTMQKETVLSNRELLSTTVQTVDRQRNRLQNLIDQVLSNSLGFKDISLSTSLVSSNELLQNLITDYTLTNTAIKINMLLEPKDTSLTIDKFHITTALLNVLDNAVKYGGKSIVVSSKSSKNMFHISIQDDGIGIAKEEQNKVFDKFYRVGNTNVHTTKGLGLGLYYVHQIIKAHKGSVELDSTVGEGTKININIPIQNA